jgi:beta-galactosidase
MKKIGIVFLLVVIQSVVFAQSTSPQRLSLDKGWRFHLGDIPFPEINTGSMSYANAKAGKAWAAAAPDYDDTKWRKLNLPHDWAVEAPYDSTTNATQGYRKRGIGWYRRYFKIDSSDRGKHIELQFDGISTHCTVWVNGSIVHRNWCGYTSFYIDITSVAKYGDEVNNIAIRVDAVDQEGWWYEGAGIYRHTWLVKRSPVHIITDGVFAHPLKQSTTAWTIPVEATIENTGKNATNVEVESMLYDPSGKLVTQASAAGKVNMLGQLVTKLNLQVKNPQLWWVDNPVLYTVKTIVKQSGKQIDELTTSCGFRTIRFTADSGFYLNDKHVKLQGTCNHQDAAGVGVAVPESLWDFRIKKLKEMGSNAYRCAHNPPAKEFLDACDRLGMLVMDENRNFNASPEYIRQLQWMVRRDRNHPSIILWSVFNEEPMQGSESGYEMVRRMNAEVKQLDTTRPVTAAMNGGFFAAINVSQAVDVGGFNYQINNYDRFHKANPTLPLTSSEDVSGIMQRDVYVTDKNKHTLDAYDTQKPSWGVTHRVGWKAIAERPYLAGCFVWTGFDYRGEPTPYTWPTASSNFGIMDVCGFPKTAFYIHQAQWVTDKNVIYLVPHWNWPTDSIGKSMKVMVMSNAETVKLLLNGKLVGEQKVDIYEMNTWQVPYAPGSLEAVGYKNGKEVSRCKVETTGQPAGLQLVADRLSINGDGWDAMPITVQAIDSKGRVVRTANLPVEFEIVGTANIIGVDNGDPNCHEPQKGNKRSLYNGLAQLIVQSAEEGGGTVTLTATSPGLKPAKINIAVLPKKAAEAVLVVNPPLLIEGWKVSPVTTTKPDANQELAITDQNSWEPTKTGQLQNLNNGNFIIYRTSLVPYQEQQKNGGVLLLKNVTGKAEVYLDKKLVATKSNVEKGDIKVKVNPANGERIISILIEGEQGKAAGLGGIVTIQ